MTKQKNLRFALLGCASIILAAYLIIAFYYNTHFQPGTFINSIDYSGKTVEDVEGDISSQIAAYKLTILGRDGVTDTILAEDFSYQYVSDGQIAKLKKNQNSFKWPISYFTKEYQEMAATCDYNKEQLEAAINDSLFFQPDVVLPFADAQIIYGENGFEIQKEDWGTTLDSKKVMDVIMDKVCTSETNVSLEEEQCYINPSILSDDEAMKEALKLAKRYTNLTVTYDFGDRSEVLNRDVLKDWITIDEAFNVNLDKEKVIEYVNYLGYYYTTFSSTRDFTRFDGKVIQVRGGDYGWIIDRTKEVEELYNILLLGNSVTREPIYRQTAKSRNKNDIGSTYIELNLKKQRVWLFVDGKKVLVSNVVTGNKTQHYDTPAGIYQITYKERDATLNGENYSSPVKYWMPFNKNIGLHDASWRKEFGKDIYIKNGSHGCVNMPEAKAKKLYESIEKGTPVVVY